MEQKFKPIGVVHQMMINDDEYLVVILNSETYDDPNVDEDDIILIKNGKNMVQWDDPIYQTVFGMYKREFVG